MRRSLMRENGSRTLNLNDTPTDPRQNWKLLSPRPVTLSLLPLKDRK